MANHNHNQVEKFTVVSHLTNWTNADCGLDMACWAIPLIIIKSVSLNNLDIFLGIAEIYEAKKKTKKC